MYRRSLFLWFSVCCFYPVLTTYAQNNDSWFGLSLQGDKTKITEIDNLIIYEQVREEQSTYPARVDSVAIVKRLNDSTYIVNKPNRQGDFALMAYQEIHPNAIKAIGIYYPSDSAEDVENRWHSQKLPNWKELTMQWVFSEAMVTNLENAPRYDEVQREDLLQVLAIREPLSPLLTSYMEDHPETQAFRMYRFVETKAQQEFIKLGYNPYKQVPYNFEKQFEGDTEVIKALSEPMSFEKN